MIAKITALVALAALATANGKHGGACTIKTITPTTTKPPTTRPTTSTTKDDCSTRTVCLDYVNECGIWYGGCVPDCKPWPTFSKPPCPSTTTTTTKPPTSTPTQDNCSTRTICLDYVNECGMMYGGCVPDCKPWPTFSKPPCPTTTTAPPTTTTTSSVDDCRTRTICIDYVNECGMMYGGCIPDCKPWPTFSKPPCPSTTTLRTVVATK
ncbi:hypothetical protein ISF_01895 [Cordyceps fumosorosea ARSEF 2679]|uniref:Uncharacterized protein n=1 Tax=Cordyceps fumosorosea (strain ARSEF 2679) TaxID=1081104 RepID=A0A162LJD5_CORFA|nr:hypothetical protein ISF_01895 [Cordyceps fumosorosea ARSEF 2679]OAA71344.1 hypothetical protein ISF_01895 [Cordyceps fumosorosea ARSEF 2679]